MSFLELTSAESLYLLGYHDLNREEFEASCVAALERARVVGVLDAHPTERGWEVYPHGKGWRCGLGIAKQFDGATPDAARAAAAKAIESGEV